MGPSENTPILHISSESPTLAAVQQFPNKAYGKVFGLLPAMVWWTCSQRCFHRITPLAIPAETAATDRLLFDAAWQGHEHYEKGDGLASLHRYLLVG